MLRYIRRCLQFFVAALVLIMGKKQIRKAANRGLNPVEESFGTLVFPYFNWTEISSFLDFTIQCS